jgi:hypothetical protein
MEVKEKTCFKTALDIKEEKYINKKKSKRRLSFCVLQQIEDCHLR